MQMRMPSVLRSLGTRQELGGREWIKVEHLGAGKLPVANLVEPEDWGVQLATGRGAPALVPQHHNLVLARSDNARRAHARFHFERRPMSQPSRGFVPAMPSGRSCFRHREAAAASGTPRHRGRPRQRALGCVLPPTETPATPHQRRSSLILPVLAPALPRQVPRARRYQPPPDVMAWRGLRAKLQVSAIMRASPAQATAMPPACRSDSGCNVQRGQSRRSGRVRGMPVRRARAYWQHARPTPSHRR